MTPTQRDTPAVPTTPGWDDVQKGFHDGLWPDCAIDGPHDHFEARSTPSEARGAHPASRRITESEGREGRRSTPAEADPNRPTNEDELDDMREWATPAEALDCPHPEIERVRHHLFVDPQIGPPREERYESCASCGARLRSPENDR